MKKFLISLLVLSQLFIPVSQAELYNFTAYNVGTRTAEVSRVVSGMTFGKDFGNGTTNPNADFASGSDIATITVTRDATHPATYINDDGTMSITTTSNTIRYSNFYNSTGLVRRKGILVENGRTNLCVRSYNQSDASWSSATNTAAWRYTGAAGAASLWVNSPSGITSVNSTMTGLLGNPVPVVTYGGSGSGSDLHISGPFSLTSGSVYSASIYLYTSIARTFSFECKKNASPYTNYGLLYTTPTIPANTWVRVEATFTANATVSDAELYIPCQPSPAGNNYSFTWDMPQVELGPVATSFIPNQASALTRNEDQIKFLNTSNRVNTAETMFVKFTPLGGSFANDGTDRYLIYTDTGVGNRGMRKPSNTATIRANVDGNTGTVDSPSTGTTGTSYVVTGVAIAGTGDPNESIYINGGSAQTSNGDWTNNPPTYGTYFYLGSGSSGGVTLNGIIEQVYIFNSALSAANILAIANIMNT